MVLSAEKRAWRLIELVFVDEAEILRINNEHLQHDYVTDIITFPYHEGEEPVEGTLFCCAPQIFKQAEEHGADPLHEFARILIHGLLHLCDYDDKTSSDKHRMTEKENYYLSKLQFNT
ncbi:rRNA maturation RNase YbeY [Cyclonatronum proteinivorum]|uniref:Endoribonuclease YbeY n=1 Tax=Cyclonatronum proteinivorum TaxID=1457365 RepID=A0A345UKR7_9BACT|nr:rRNA maturation RNase YbeY [Cyclonatronum proteinivorum]